LFLYTQSTLNEEEVGNLLARISRLHHSYGHMSYCHLEYTKALESSGNEMKYGMVNAQKNQHGDHDICEGIFKFLIRTCSKKSTLNPFSQRHAAITA
jgi:hypothetical protein